MHYRKFGDIFPGPDEYTDVQNNRIPVESWNCAYSNYAISQGAHDTDVIIPEAKALAAWGHPIFLRYFWEMNLPYTANGRKACYDQTAPSSDYASGNFNEANFILAWNHIRSVFSAYGASNVIFLWNPNADDIDPGAHKMSDYYPGVDGLPIAEWSGIDRYDKTPGGNASFWLGFGNEYNELMQANPNWPIIIGETGALSYVPADQMAFLQNMVTNLQAYPNVWGLIYFDAQGQSVDKNHNDVLFNYTIVQDQLSAFAGMANDPYLSRRRPFNIPD